jgi:hypothetical protein
MDLRAPILARLSTIVKSTPPERPTYLAENVNIFPARFNPALLADFGQSLATCVLPRSLHNTRPSEDKDFRLAPGKINAGAFFCGDKNPVI